MASKKAAANGTAAAAADGAALVDLDELAAAAAGQVTGEELDELAAAAAAAGPVVLEYGRYRVFAAPDGGWVIARAVDTCETCQACGCGVQADLIEIPAFIIAMAKTQGGGMMGRLKAIMGARRGG